MFIKKCAIAAGISVGVSFGSAAAEPKTVAMTNYIDLDFFGIFPDCDGVQAVARDASPKDNQYCADMDAIHEETTSSAMDLQVTYMEQMVAMDKNYTANPRKLDALNAWMTSEQNDLYAAERVKCHKVQAASYIGEGVTITIKPGTYIP